MAKESADVLNLAIIRDLIVCLDIDNNDPTQISYYHQKNILLRELLSGDRYPPDSLASNLACAIYHYAD